MTTSQQMLDNYIAAETAILSGQSYRFGERMLTRANLIEVQAGRREWQAIVNAEQRIAIGGTSPRYQQVDFS